MDYLLSAEHPLALPLALLVAGAILLILGYLGERRWRETKRTLPREFQLSVQSHQAMVGGVISLAAGLLLLLWRVTRLLGG